MSQHPSDQELKKAVNAAVAKADGQPIGLKTLQKVSAMRCLKRRGVD